MRGSMTVVGTSLLVGSPRSWWRACGSFPDLMVRLEICGYSQSSQSDPGLSASHTYSCHIKSTSFDSFADIRTTLICWKSPHVRLFAIILLIGVASTTYVAGDWTCPQSSTALISGQAASSTSRPTADLLNSLTRSFSFKHA